MQEEGTQRLSLHRKEDFRIEQMSQLNVFIMMGCSGSGPTAMADNSRQLEAQALSKRCRCLQENIMAFDSRRNHLSL
jgi:hypothetical protein